MSDFDRELVREILHQIYGATATILKRFQSIDTADDFLNSDDGLLRLDGICMQLIAIGESIKNLDKVTSGTLLPSYPQVEWKRVMGMRDIISHHYFDMDAEVVFTVCDRHMTQLQSTIQTMLDDPDVDKR
ncbi:MAG: DUF86 domain-containing protein [Candidatus Tectomicrobia bacterium]|nr:DUF86 domain-containing protein [Candidatus Tectomicrobia bacterium]